MLLFKNSCFCFWGKWNIKFKKQSGKICCWLSEQCWPWMGIVPSRLRCGDQAICSERVWQLSQTGLPNYWWKFSSRLSAFLMERSSHRTPLLYIWWLHHFQVTPFHYSRSTKPHNLKLQLAAVLQYLWLWKILTNENFLQNLYRISNIHLVSL